MSEKIEQILSQELIYGILKIFQQDFHIVKEIVQMLQLSQFYLKSIEVIYHIISHQKVEVFNLSKI